MPNQTLLEFRNGYKDTLLPFHPDLILEVNDELKTITAHFPDGILDL
jgi:ribosomal 30S subunit maturation factor RimM